ncbi:MAG: serine/threonine protein phosphatase [Rhizobiaceae bacterium]|nr:serine/threonine protein phosphatase [Rhizobiaceae bacterium]
MTSFRRPRIELAPEDYDVIYALSDIHGCYQAMVQAEQRIVRDASTIPGRKLLLFLGDYVDRGPNSAEVLSHLCAPPPDGFERHMLCGNHDDVFLKFLIDPEANTHWLEFGALPTIQSYGVDIDRLLDDGATVLDVRDALKQAMPRDHVELLFSLSVAVSVGDILFVHAGIRPRIALAQQTDEDLMWIREPFLIDGPQLPLLVVHGHTPAKYPDFGNGHIGIDTAVSMGGSLTVLKIEGDRKTIFTQTTEP